jgi:hypothetical protein
MFSASLEHGLMVHLKEQKLPVQPGCSCYWVAARHRNHCCAVAAHSTVLILPALAVAAVQLTLLLGGEDIRPVHRINGHLPVDRQNWCATEDAAEVL